MQMTLLTLPQTIALTIFPNEPPLYCDSGILHGILLRFASTDSLLIRSSFDADRNLVLMQISGAISVDELVAEYDAIIEHKDFRPNMHAVWDLSDLDLTRIPVSDIRSLQRQLRQYVDRRGDDYKAALVTKRAADYALMRIYISILKLIGNNISFRLYRSLDEAYEWITR